MAIRKMVKELKDKISELEEILRVIDERIAGKVSADIQEYEIASDIGRRRVERIPVSELSKLRDQYRRELGALKDELKRMEGKSSRNVLVRF